MIVIVSSAVQNRVRPPTLQCPMSMTPCVQEYRDVIRSSWGRPSIPSVRTRLAFMLGLPHGPGERALQRSLETEARRHQDIVQGNVLDTYRNLTFKSVMGHLWVSQFCRQAELVVKADDDIYVDLYGTFTVASRHFQDQVSPPTAALQSPHCSPHHTDTCSATGTTSS